MSGSVGALGSAQINSEISTVEARLEEPITLLDSQATTDKADISAWGSIKGGISSLSSALAGISNAATLADRTATSSTSSVASATATNTAQAGTYNLTNVTLAKAQEIYSSVQTSATTSLGTGAGSLTFTQNGKTETVSVGSGSMTLNGIASAINKVAGGVAASVVNTSGGARLVLQGSATGSSQAFTVKANSSASPLARFDYPPSSGKGSMTLAQTATNATLDINGVPVSNATNSLSSAVSGVTIKLAGSGTSTVTVSSAPTGLTKALSSVATSLNSAISSIATQIKFVPASSAATSASGSKAAKSGPLLGNFTATDLSNQLMTAVSGAAASGMTSNSIGLTVSSAGAVSFSSSTFATAYAKNPTAVQNLVTQIYKSLDGVTTGALGSANSTGGGNIGAQTSSLQSDVTSITSQVAQITKQNDDQLNILVSEYSTAEAASTSAQVTQAYLSIFDTTTSSSSVA